MIRDLFPFYVDVFFPLSLLRLFSILTVYVSNTTMSYRKQELPTFREHLRSPPTFCWGLCYSSFYVVLLCLYILSSVLLCAFRFPHEKQVRFVFTSCCLLEGSGLYIICVCLRIVLSNTCWVVSLLCMTSSSVSYVASFSGLFNFDWSFGIL
jgi:hypothetical protein